VPCCTADVTLNDLVYDMACGFARFEIKILNPNKAEPTDAELTTIGKTLSHPLRQIWSRY